MRVLGSSILALEAIVVLLAIPVALATTDPQQPWLVGVGFALLALLCLAVIGVVTRPYGPAAGWVVQALVIASGILVPAMFVLGLIFAALWFGAVRLGTRADAARRAADAGRSEH